MSGRRWAHVVAVGQHGLRRGSWYEILDESVADVLVLDVAGRPRTVPRDAVEVEPSRPLAWTIVVNTPPDEYFGGLHGVCPNCVLRARLAGDEQELSCPACGLTFPVDWSRAP